MELINIPVTSSSERQADVDKLLTTFTAEIYQQIAFITGLVFFVTGLVSFFGVIANIINLVVFYRQGLNTTINVSLFALSVADFSTLLTQLWMIVTSLFPVFDLPIVFSDILHLTGGWPHETFTRISCTITVYITAERCLCVVFPTKITQIITLKRAAITIILIYIITWLLLVPVYSSHYLGWNFYPDVNRTLLGAVTASHKEMVDKTFHILHAVFGVVSLTAAFIFTSILIWTLKEKSAWRRSANIQQQKSEALSNRDRSTLSMVVLIAVILLICYTPSVVVSVSAFFEPEFGHGRRYMVIYNLCWSLALLLENLNASINILLYLKMSSKFRSTFVSLFKLKKEK